MTIFKLFRSRPILRGAVLLPAAITLIFGFFNLSSVVEPEKALATLELGVVNLDEGAPGPGGTPIAIGGRIVAGLGTQLPMKTREFPDEATALDALDMGQISAAIVLQKDFSLAILAGGSPNVKVWKTDHLSLMEMQFARALPAQIQLGLSTAVLAARAQLSAAGSASASAASTGPPLPPVQISAESLHTVVNTRILQAPIVIGFASWLAGLVGAVLLFQGTQAELHRGSAPLIAAVRGSVPVLASLLSGFAVVLVLGVVSGAWDGFWEIWAFRGLVGAAAMALFTALFAVLGWFALVVALPLAFYQGLASGIVVPVGAAPEWATWMNNVLPLPEIAVGTRTLLIGGPDGSIPWASVTGTWVVAVLVMWAVTIVVGRRRSSIAEI